VSLCLCGESAGQPEEELDWLKALLRQAMTETMAGEGTPLQKASAIARLGNLYLKARRSAELEQANKELRRRAVMLEERLAGAEGRLAALEAAPAAMPGDVAGQEGVLPVAVGLNHELEAAVAEIEAPHGALERPVAWPSAAAVPVVGAFLSAASAPET
jgi:hypothetical protein